MFNRVTVFFITHDVDEAMLFLDRMHVLTACAGGLRVC